MRIASRRLVGVALAALSFASGPQAGAAPVPSSTAQEGRHYLLWTRGSDARIWELDAAGGLVRERSVSWTPQTRGEEPWLPRELVRGADGGLRLLWTSPPLGRSVAWHLDADFVKTGETVFQAGNPPLNWYSTDLERKGDGSGRLVWFNGQVGTAVVWKLDAAGNKVATNFYTPAADLGAWVPVDYSTAPDGSARLVWTYVWNGSGPWGGRSVVWFLDGNDVKVGAQGLTYEPNWYLRSYHFGNDGRLRFLLGNDLEGRGKLCTALTDTTAAPIAEGWGPGTCKSFGPERGWILRSYTGNVPIDLGPHERAMIEREADRLGYPEESFLSPTEVRVDDMILSTDQIESTGDLTILNVERWPGGRVYLDFPPDATPTFIANVLDGCRRWANVAGVSCLAGDLEPRLSVESATGNVCEAFVGLRPSGNFLTTDPSGWCVPHELGHALGFIHTHQREDRDEFVLVHPENVLEPYGFAIVDRYRVLPFGFGPYDFRSVMHYSPFHFSKPPLYEPTITRLDGGLGLGGDGRPSALDEDEMARIYPGGPGTVSPVGDFIVPPAASPASFFVSSVVIGGVASSPAVMAPLPPDAVTPMKLVLTNSGRPWLSNEGLRLSVSATGPVEVAAPSTFFVLSYVPGGGTFEIAFDVETYNFGNATSARLDLALRNGANQLLGAGAVHLNVGPTGTASASASRVLEVEPQAMVLSPGAILPFDVRVDNPSALPETVRVRGYVDGAHVTDPQASFQLRTLDPGQSETFSFSAVVPTTPGTLRAYGQLYTVSGSIAFTGNQSDEVLVKVTPSCGGCTFQGVACGQEGRCLNDPSQGCGVAHVCGAACDAHAEVHFVNVTPDPVPAGAPFTVRTRVKNLSASGNTFSIRGYTDHGGVTPGEQWAEDQSLQPLEVRDTSFVFTAPASGSSGAPGSFQAYGQVFCPGAPLPFVGNSSAPVTIAASAGGGGGGGPYTGIVPSATIVSVGPQPAGAGGTVSLHARVHNHNGYTTSFYLRPYATAPTFVELPRRAVAVPPHSDVTELIEFPVPNQPGATLDLHFQAEYNVGQALSGASATGVPIGGPLPPPNPIPPPENICPGPNDGDTTGCPLDGSGHVTYRTCASCRAAYPAAPGCVQKVQLDWCWKPQ
jgi:hypothetical protein